ncbi:MAG: aldose 1-epimerase [candidate division KSB1 bacterium]|nr:aldose 1-epimerase [candidate division KSB1 bacterium]MDZ7301025.1 aldose 1-epimerase [candidate division KSB1 bacterium]MDZ7310297.1 aldose 1-epimerase [candidate division KSB1 bacterium]
MIFSHSIERRTGWEGDIVVLTATGGEMEQEARIAPKAGCKLFSYIVNGIERLRQPRSWSDMLTLYCGIPILFPTPNRVRDCRYEFEGRIYQHRKNNEDRFIHGLVFDEPWEAKKAKINATSVSFSAWLELEPWHPNYAAFPFPHKITMTFALVPDGLSIAYKVENTGDGRLPFGFGLHPWFRVPGSRDDIIICAPATHQMELEPKTLLPTGRCIPINKTKPDFSKPANLSHVDIDAVYFGMRPDKPAWIEYAREKLRLELRATEDFTHLLIYSPAGQDFLCVENQTCSGDAHNLFARGFREQAHLLILEPGQTHRGEVEMVWVKT